MHFHLYRMIRILIFNFERFFPKISALYLLKIFGESLSPGLKGPQGVSSNRIICLSVLRNVVQLKNCNSLNIERLIVTKLGLKIHGRAFYTSVYWEFCLYCGTFLPPWHQCFIKHILSFISLHFPSIFVINM